MSNVYAIADLHLLHKNIMGFAGEYRDGNTYIENAYALVTQWNAKIRKRDTVYVLGDVVWNTGDLSILSELKGDKILVRGNHDTFPTKEYLKYFNEVHGVVKYKGFWLSHIPIHPAELRGCKNIHGHVHQNSIRDGYNQLDDRYINVCVENAGSAPVSIADIRSGAFVGRVK